MTAQLQGNDKATYVQDMFGRIAERYNLLNRLMTFGTRSKLAAFRRTQGRPTTKR